MRSKLQKFTEFTQTLLPHETAYLLDHQQFDDKAKLGILQLAHDNCSRLHIHIPYDERIDKRKYSHLKQWISERLHAADVDTEYEWLLELERALETDRITPEQEERLLHHLDECSPVAYHFVKCYELGLLYRNFLLIRLRYAAHRKVQEFLSRYRPDYERALTVREKLNEASEDIVAQYVSHRTESIQWIQWLTEVFYNETLDGWSRYMALVRLTFVYYNYGNLEPLLEKYRHLDDLFRQGRYYSKRLLINYYGNRLLLHARLQEQETAEYYGYLSVRVKTTDYIHYVNNLCALLLRGKKYSEALTLMKEALPESHKTRSFHNKIGFVAHYIRCLHHNDRHRAAENYADAYLRAYRKEIFEHRRHTFFSAYLEILLAQKNYAKILRLVDKYRLLQPDRQQSAKPSYLPTIPWYYIAAAYQKGRLDEASASAQLPVALQEDRPQGDKSQQLGELLRGLEGHLPESVLRQLRSRIL